MNDSQSKIELDASLQKLANCIDAGDRASLDGNFVQAATLYEGALSLLNDQVSFDLKEQEIA